MRRKLAWLFAASGLVVGACTMPPEAEVIGGLPCDPQGACPAGYQCVASKCVQSGSAAEGAGGSAAKEAGTLVDAGSSGGRGTGGSGAGGRGVAGAGAGGATLDASYRDVSVGTLDATLDAHSEASVVDGGSGGFGAGGVGTGGTGAGGIGTGGKGTGGTGTGGKGTGGAGTGGTGSGGSPGAGVVCGTMICAAGTHCCFPSSGTATCSASTCPSGSTTITCDGPEDCPPGDECCMSASGGAQSYTCKTQCGIGDVPIACSGSQNCPAGDVCCEETTFPLRALDTVCSTGCSGLTTYTLCMTNADCPGSQCQASTQVLGFRRCN